MERKYMYKKLRNWVTPWSEVLPEKLIVAELVKFLAFYGIRNFTVHYRVQKHPLAPLLKLMNLVYTLVPNVIEIQINTVLPSALRSSEYSLSSTFAIKTVY